MHACLRSAKYDLGAYQHFQQLLWRACIDGVHVNAKPLLDVVSLGLDPFWSIMAREGHIGAFQRGDDA